MAKDKIPITPAIRLLRQAKLIFTPHLYSYEERGGTAVSARELGVEEHHVIIPMTVLEELDKLKSGRQSIAADCRQAIRGIDEILGRARNVAEATGGFLGLGNRISPEEEIILAELAKAFEAN